MDSTAENKAESVEMQAPEVEQRVVQLEEEVARLKKQLQFAKGTRDLAEKAQEVREATLPEAIESLLRSKIMTTEELVRATGQSRDRVVATIKASRAKVADVGTPDRARWTWRVGSEASPKELRALVRRLITFQPMEFRDLVAATGAREGLIQGHLIEIRKTEHVRDLGTPGKARWFLMPETARDAHLPAARRRRNGRGQE